MPGTVPGTTSARARSESRRSEVGRVGRVGRASAGDTVYKSYGARLSPLPHPPALTHSLPPFPPAWAAFSASFTVSSSLNTLSACSFAPSVLPASIFFHTLPSASAAVVISELPPSNSAHMLCSTSSSAFVASSVSSFSFLSLVLCASISACVCFLALSAFACCCWLYFALTCLNRWRRRNACTFRCLSSSAFFTLASASSFRLFARPLAYSPIPAFCISWACCSFRAASVCAFHAFSIVSANVSSHVTGCRHSVSE